MSSATAASKSGVYLAEWGMASQFAILLVEGLSRPFVSRTLNKGASMKFIMTCAFDPGYVENGLRCGLSPNARTVPAMALGSCGTAKIAEDWAWILSPRLNTISRRRPGDGAQPRFTITIASQTKHIKGVAIGMCSRRGIRCASQSNRVADQLTKGKGDRRAGARAIKPAGSTNMGQKIWIESHGSGDVELALANCPGRS